MNRKINVRFPTPGSPVRVTIPGGRTLDTTTCSEPFNVPRIVAVNGLPECIPVDWCAPLPPEAPPLVFEDLQSPFGRYKAVVPRWGGA